MAVRKFVQIEDRKGISIFEVDEDEKKMTRNIVRFICDVGKQETEKQTQEVADLITNGLNKISLRIFEKKVASWRKTDKHNCPECNDKLSSPTYICEKCNLKIKLKITF